MVTPGVCVYDGQWVSGERQDANATVKYNNGEVYIGAFVREKREGEAVWTDAKGNVFRGRYKDNEKDLSSWTCHQTYNNGTHCCGVAISQ